MYKLNRDGITFVIRTLRGGGAERVLAHVANHFARQNRDVTVITSRPTTPDDEDRYTLDSRIKRVILPYWNWKIPSWKYEYVPSPFGLRNLRRAIVESNNLNVIAFMEKSIIPTVIACANLWVRVIASIHANPTDIWNNGGPINRFLIRNTYLHADMITVLVNSWIYDWGYQIADIHKFWHLPNYVEVPDLNATPTPAMELPEKFISCLGRLHPCKGYDILLPVFARISKDYPDLSLVIFGEGSERGPLESLVNALGISERVKFAGFVSNPHQYVKRALCHVLPSRTEGLPMSLMEVMSIGMPVVSFDCPTGPSELIRNKENGILVPRENAYELEAGIRYMLEHPQERENMAQQARAVSDTFRWDAISKHWECLLWPRYLV